MTIYIYIYMFYMCAIYTYMFYICYTHIYVLSWVVNVNRLEIPTTLKSPQIVTSIETIYDWAFWQPYSTFEILLADYIMAILYH